MDRAFVQFVLGENGIACDALFIAHGRGILCEISVCENGSANAHDAAAFY